MTLKRAEQDGIHEEQHNSVGRPYIVTSPEDEDELGSDSGSEWSEIEDVRLKDTTDLS